MTIKVEVWLTDSLLSKRARYLELIEEHGSREEINDLLTGLGAGFIGIMDVRLDEAERENQK